MFRFRRPLFVRDGRGLPQSTGKRHGILNVVEFLCVRLIRGCWICRENGKSQSPSVMAIHKLAYCRDL